jgi:hypothetical protein
MILVQTKLINQHTHTSYKDGDQEALRRQTHFLLMILYV